MSGTKGSNAIVAVVGFYVGELAERDDELALLKGGAAASSTLLGKLARYLEEQVEGLSVKTPEEAVAIATDSLRAAKQNAVLLVEQTALMGRVAAALREALLAVGATRTGVAPPTTETPLQELVARVGVALTDLRCAERGVHRGNVDRHQAVIVTAARAWVAAPTASALQRLTAAVNKLDPAEVERLRREAAVLTAARAVGDGNDASKPSTRALIDAALDLQLLGARAL